MHIESKTLCSMVEEVDQQHRESMRSVKEGFAEVHLGELAAEFGESRRHFLRNAVIGGAVITVGSQIVPVGRFMPKAWGQDMPSDADLAAFAQSVELTAVAAYTMGAPLLTDQAVIDAATTFAQHHQEHADALGAFAGDAAVTEPNAALLQELGPQLQEATDQTAVVQFAKNLEESAASTYFFAIGALMDPAAAGALATILPVESQHATVLATVLGLPADQYLYDFQTDDTSDMGGAAALDPAMFPVS